MSYAEVAILSPYLASLRAVNRSSSKLHCMLLIYSSNCFPLTPLTCDGPWRVYNTGSSLLSHLVTNRRLRLFGHIAPSLSREDHHRALAACIRQVPPDWKRAAGRPSHTWLHAIEADLGPLNFGLTTAWRKATTRDEWRHIVNTATLQRSTL